MASFASIVKKELTQLEVHPEHAKAELSALIRMNGSITLMAHRFVLNIQTENPAIARRIYSLIRQVYHHEANLVVHRKMKLKKNYQYIVRLTEGVNDIRLTGYFGSNHDGHFNDCASQRFKGTTTHALVFARRLFGKWLGEQPGNIALSSGNLLIICRS